MTTTQYYSLEKIRAEKQGLKQQLKADVENLKADVSDCFMPRNQSFLQSPNKYMNYVGYAITIYKTVTTIRGVFKFFSKRR